MPEKELAYVVSYVGTRGARDEIRRMLKEKNLKKAQTLLWRVNIQ